VRQITRKYGAQVFSFSVKKDDYDACVPSDLRKYMGEDHYTWAIRQAGYFAQLWRIDKQVADPYEWIFDWLEKKDKKRKEIERMFDQMEFITRKQNGHEHEYDFIDFRERASLGALKCADLLAWTNYNFGLQQWKLLPRPLHPFAKLAWEDFASMPDHGCPTIAGLFPRYRSKKTEWNLAVFLKPEQLKELIKRERDSPRFVPLLKEWEAQTTLSRRK